MAKNKSTTSKSPAGQKIKAGPKGGMHDFEGLGTQKPGVSSVSKSNTGGKFAKDRPGKMANFKGVGAQARRVERQHRRLEELRR
jgi:hypothetical protein